MEGFIHSVENFGAADGPGIRFVIFMQGCPMRCKYCHNPDTWQTGAGFKATEHELIGQAEKYRDFWGGEGGITLGGGEPMLQAEFAAALLGLAKSRGINTALDTSAQPYDSRDKNISKLLGLCDTVLLDIKHIDSEKHRQLTGHGNENILECARELERRKVPVWIRHVIVPGLESDEELQRLGEFIRSLSNVQRVELLKYHTMGKPKWDKLGRNYPLAGVRGASDADILHAQQFIFI